jgi:hypothetical protein
VNVREYTEGDFAEIKRLCEQSGFEYNLPTISGEEFYSRRIAGNISDVGMACFLRHTSECYLVVNPEWRTPAWRLEALRQLHRAAFADAREAKVQELIAFLPPRIERRFGHRLKTQFGWNDWERGAEWRGYTRMVP